MPVRSCAFSYVMVQMDHEKPKLDILMAMRYIMLLFKHCLGL